MAEAFFVSGKVRILNLPFTDLFATLLSLILNGPAADPF
jgi:hypothetical protein